MAIDCGQSMFFAGRSREQVQSDVDKALCTDEKQCNDGEHKTTCTKRSLVGPSKEDPKLYLGFVWCPCGKDLPKAEKRERTTSNRISRVRKAPRQN